MSKEVKEVEAAKVEVAEKVMLEQAAKIKVLEAQVAAAENSIKVSKEKTAAARKTKELNTFEIGNKILKFTSSEFVVPFMGKIEASKVAENPEEYEKMIVTLLENKSSLINIID